MSRRSSLPGAAELFRSTGDGTDPGHEPAPAPASRAAQLLAEAPSGPDRPVTPGSGSSSPAAAPHALRDGAGEQIAVASIAPTARRRVAADAERRPTGRERHDEKITVYLSPEELMDLERARLTLRGEHGLAVDRGRIVREALVMVLADLEAQGERSTLVRRLHGA